MRPLTRIHADAGICIRLFPLFSDALNAEAHMAADADAGVDDLNTPNYIYLS